MNNTQSVIRTDHISERLSTVALLIQCAQNDLQVGRLRSVKARLQRIDECLAQAKETVNEELAMPDTQARETYLQQFTPSQND